MGTDVFIKKSGLRDIFDGILGLPTKKEEANMKTLKQYLKNRDGMPFRVSQCLYGASAILTFYVIGQITMNL